MASVNPEQAEADAIERARRAGDYLDLTRPSAGAEGVAAAAAGPAAAAAAAHKLDACKKKIKQWEFDFESRHGRQPVHDDVRASEG